MYDISIFMPAIRVPRWDSMFASIQKSCKRHSFELVMCGPFELTENLKKHDNVRMIIDNGSPSRCAQRAAIESTGKLLAHVVDDALFLEDSLDEAIDLYNHTCTTKDVVNLRYTEGANYQGGPMPPNYWFIKAHPPLLKPGVSSEYKMSCHHLIDREYFRELGGYDCTYEYQNYNRHDLMYRVQYNGGEVYDSPTQVTACDLFPLRSGDHNVIMDAQQLHDEPLYQEMYSDPDILKKRLCIPLDNWKNSEEVWQRRFSKGVPKNYEGILIDSMVAEGLLDPDTHEFIDPNLTSTTS